MSDYRLSRRKVGISMASAALGIGPFFRYGVAQGLEGGHSSHVVTDARGRRVEVARSQRIVCIGGTITETLYALGAEKRILAVDTTSTRPARALHEKKSLGYMRMMSAEGVLSLQPDVIFASTDAGPPAAMAQLVASHIPVVFVDSTPSAEAIIGRTRFLASLVGAQRAGEALCQRIKEQFRTVSQWRQHHPVSRHILFIIRMTNGRPMAAGTGTAADSVMALAGAVNAEATMQGYKILDDEALIALQPDIVLTMSQGGEQTRAALLSNRAFLLTPAGRNKAIITMEGERLLGFGPQTPDAVLELAHSIERVSLSK